LNSEKGEFLSRGMIHGDFNESNILISENDESNVCAILDFGDCSYSFYIFEVAIASLYMMLDAVRGEVNQEHLDQIEIGAHVIAGYLSEFKLSSSEFYLILDCIKGRIAQSLMNGCYANRLNPDDIYVFATQQNAWSLLCLLNETTDEVVYKKWLQILETDYNIFIQ
jgi:hydroxylysine kinase